MDTAFTTKVVTATGDTGEPVYLTEDDRWSADPAEAERIDDEAHAQLRLIDAVQGGDAADARLAEAED